MEYRTCKIYDCEISNIIKGVRVADCMILNNADNSEKSIEEPVIPNIQDLAISNVLNCSFCDISFNDVIDQRNHYKLDWHRFNLIRALRDKQPVSEDVFDSLADEISSISGSESEISNIDDSDSDINEIQSSAKNEVEKLHSQELAKKRHSKAFFENSDNQIFSVYKCLLHSRKETISNNSLTSSLANVLVSPKKWLIVMIGGGHFAAAIFSNGVVGEHKTFHCFTVRAKQGGSQSSRDNKGGGHPKSAGASLRRYNEQALVQHVQEIMTVWAESVKQCQLIFYRATGRYNRGVLFRGKYPPLEKNDTRLRNIPFPTRRATFKEVKRVHEVLSTVEIYGSSEEYKEKYPRSPDKRTSPRKSITNQTETQQNQGGSETENVTGKNKAIRKIDRSKARSSSERELPNENINNESESDSSEDEDIILTSGFINLHLDELKEYDDTVPIHLKEGHAYGGEKEKPRKRRRKHANAFERQFQLISKKLVSSCENGDKDLLMDTLKIYDSLPETVHEGKESEKGNPMTKNDFINCLNSGASNDSKNTPLHLSAMNSLPEFVTLLLEAGADPTVTNKNRLTPYVVSGNKETRKSFREFVSQYPDRIDCKKAKIPEPLSEEMQKVCDEKKRERNRMKRKKDKQKKKEMREEREEEKEKKRFLALSDREKCALAAERRMLASATANLKSAKPPVLSRCFLCGIDITGKVPFEYGTNRFCSIPCVKSHRKKTNSYGVEI